jgi:hypothetical protein
MLSRVGPIANLRVMIAGRDDLDEIPAGAPTFIMPSARAAVRNKYGALGGPGMPIQPPRQFSDASAKELLAFLIRANIAALAPDMPTGAGGVIE